MGANLDLRYHERLGGGHSGEVFKVEWFSQNLGSYIDAAAKKIRYEGGITDSAKQEIEFLKQLNHMNIIRYYDTAIEKEHVVIITEYAAKGSLYDYLKGKDKLSDRLRNRWIFHLANGIHHLKENNLTHRDLKSPNCVITENNVLKICDFGLARYLTSTTTTNMKGTMKWLAPEAIRDQQLSPQADIFAFGIIVWEIVSCDEPYKGMRIETIMYQVCESDLRPKIPEDCPDFLRKLMEKCWHGDHKQRPRSLELVENIKYQFRADLGENDGADWKMKHEINHCGELHFMSSDHLAICTYSSVEVYRVTREEIQLLYTLTSDEFKGDRVWPCGVAVSESMPDSLFVICRDKPYVYQFPSHEASQYVKKYQIHDGKVKPLCIAANANTAVIGLSDALVVCSLPDFSNQKIVKLSIGPLDLCITASSILVMGKNEIVIKSLDSMDQDLCRISPPQGSVLRAASYRNDARQLYVACYHGGDKKGGVYKYTWDGHGTLQYVNTGRVIDNLGPVWNKGLSLSSDGLLAVSETSGPVKIFSLEY